MCHVVFPDDVGVECLITLLGLGAREKHEHEIEDELQVDDEVDIVNVPPLMVRVEGVVIRKRQRNINDGRNDTVVPPELELGLVRYYVFGWDATYLVDLLLFI